LTNKVRLQAPYSTHYASVIMQEEHMTPTLWIGIIIVVIVLEIIRIAMTTYVLLHILESSHLRRHGENPGQAWRSLAAAPWRARREALLDPTLIALRAAMDEVAAGRAGPGTNRAIDALDRYARALVEERSVG
jgi:hypothetical protein